MKWKLKRVFLFLLVIPVLFTGLYSCSAQTEKPVETEDSLYEFTDALGNVVSFQKPPSRVVALFGSFAETYTLAGGTLIGATEDAISERKMELGEDVEIVGTVKLPNLEKVLDLEPDFVILSADIENHVKAQAVLENAQIAHAYFHVETFDDYLAMLKIFTTITGRDDLYEKNGLAVSRQIEDVIESVPEDEPKTVLFIRAFSSGAKAKADDNMTCQMLRDLKTDNIAGRHPSLLTDLSMEVIIAEDPDFIFVVTMGEDENKALEALKNSMELNPAWQNLTAVKQGRYIVLPKDLFHYKPNARWGEAYAYLKDILYPSEGA